MLRLQRLIPLIFLFSIPSFSQNPEVLNVRFEQNGGKIVIHYDLAGKIGRKHAVSVASSDNGGRTFGVELVSLKGDVGKNISPGYDKTITWDMLRDYPRGLEGDDFVFAVNAKLQKSSKKWPYLLGAAAVGTLIYINIPPPPPDKGSVVIRVPTDI